MVLPYIDMNSPWVYMFNYRVFVFANELFIWEVGALGHIKHLSQGDGYSFSQGTTPGPEPSHRERGKGGGIQAEEGDQQPGKIAGSSIKHLMKLP